MSEKLSCDKPTCPSNCDKPTCRNIKIIGDTLIDLLDRNRFNLISNSGRSNFMLSGDASGGSENSSENVSYERKFEAAVIEIGDSLVELISKDSESKFDLEKITQIKFQHSKISIDLECLETLLLRQSESTAGERQAIEKEIIDDLKRDMKKLIALILKD